MLIGRLMIPLKRQLINEPLKRLLDGLADLIEVRFTDKLEANIINVVLERLSDQIEDRLAEQLYQQIDGSLSKDTDDDA